MQTTLFFVPDTPVAKAIDDKIQQYLSEEELYDFGNMNIAILSKNDIVNFKPFREIVTDGLGEFMSVSLYLEKIGLTCINKNSIEPLNGYDAVFVPDEEIA